jgi:hypothetical protein
MSETILKSVRNFSEANFLENISFYSSWDGPLNSKKFVLYRVSGVVWET